MENSHSFWKQGRGIKILSNKTTLDTAAYGWPSYSQLIIFTSSKIFLPVVKIFLQVVEIKHWPKLLTIKYFYWW